MPRNAWVLNRADMFISEEVKERVAVGNHKK
jgi:hypothetical protein